MKKTVTILDVLHGVDVEKRDGTFFNATQLVYDDGETRTQNFATAFLSKNASLTRQLKSLITGAAAEITLEKKGEYWNLTSVVPVTGAGPAATVRDSRTANTTPKTAAKSTFVDNSIGMQVGNALTNATALIASGHAKGTLEEVAVSVIKVGESLKVRLQSGEFAPKSAPGATKSIPLTPVLEKAKRVATSKKEALNEESEFDRHSRIIPSEDLDDVVEDDNVLF